MPSNTTPTTPPPSFFLGPLFFFGKLKGFIRVKHGKRKRSGPSAGVSQVEEVHILERRTIRLMNARENRILIIDYRKVHLAMLIDIFILCYACSSNSSSDSSSSMLSSSESSSSEFSSSSLSPDESSSSSSSSSSCSSPDSFSSSIS